GLKALPTAGSCAATAHHPAVDSRTASRFSTDGGCPISRLLRTQYGGSGSDYDGSLTACGRCPILGSGLRTADQVIPDCGPILVVDDDATFCDLVTTLVDRIGYAAVAARDGEEALETARSSNPSLVVLAG